MSRLPIPTAATTPVESQPILDAVGKSLGIVPNMFKVIALSPKALEAFTAFSGGVAKLLDLKTRERIALATAQVNGCDYCLSAHSYIGLNMAKLDESEVALARTGHSADAKADAAVTFAKKVVEARGQVGDADIAAVKLAGFSDAQIVEIVLVAVENVLTNFVNNVAKTTIDFPEVRAKAA